MRRVALVQDVFELQVDRSEPVAKVLRRSRSLLDRFESGKASNSAVLNKGDLFCLVEVVHLSKMRTTQGPSLSIRGQLERAFLSEEDTFYELIGQCLPSFNAGTT